jgi:hypothetical protein
MTDITRYTLHVLRGGFVVPLLGLLLSCEVPTEAYDNPLDEEVAAEKGIDTPALVFFPDKFDGVTAGSSVSVQLYALEVPGVTGAYIQVAYDKSKVSISSVNAGDFFSASDDPVFIYEDNSDDGFLNIYTSYLGSDSSATVSGTGNMATLCFEYYHCRRDYHKLYFRERACGRPGQPCCAQWPRRRDY